ncbi:MAG: DNA primase [Gammaproteobacteria bacterium]|nr:DNA primase [Gammaproteobacteria bacterium]
MSGKIPQSFIDDLLARIDIVDVISPLVSLRKSGREHMACCPFHDEKTPSFTVSPQKQFYHCFGCGAHGTAISFLMEYQGLSFPETVAELAGRVGLELPAAEETIAGGQGPSENLTRLYEVNELASKFFQTQLRQHPDREVATSYLKARGLTGQIAARFNLGYAPDSWNALEQGLVEQVSAAELTRLGLSIARDGGPGQYDRFRNRIIFPIIDNRGRTIGFGGRAFGDEKPKYLNSPETPLFHKSQALYGIHQVLQADKSPQRVVVVEGYMDVIALHQHGVCGAVATMGTATTSEHLRRLFRISPEVVFCFDGDQAGRKAAWKALETALPLMSDGHRVRILFLPDGEDPDTLVRQIGPEEFSALMARAKPLLDTLFAHLLGDTDMGSLDGRSQLLSRARPLLDRLPQGSLKTVGFDRLAELTRMQKSELATPAKPVASRRHQRPARSSNSPRALVARALALLMHYPGFVDDTPEPAGLAQLDDPLVVPFLTLFGLLKNRGERSYSAILHDWQSRVGDTFDDRVLQSEKLLKSEADAAREFSDIVARLIDISEQATLRVPPKGLSLAELTDNQRDQLRRTGKILK